MIYEQNYSSPRRTSRSLPADMPVLSQEQCKTILAKHFGDEAFNILSYTYENGDVKNISTHTRLKLQVQRIDEVREITFLAKTYPKPTKESTATKSQQKLFTKEYEVYTKLLKNILEDENIFLKYLHGVEKELFVVEDPTNDDYVIPTPDILDADHLKVGLTALASLHAASIVYEEHKHKELELSYKLPNTFGGALEETLFNPDDESPGYRYLEASKKATFAVLDQIPNSDVASECAQKMLETSLEKVRNLLNGNEYRRVFTHGDMWANSVAFKYENDVPTSCKLFNFQFARYAPPAFDVIEWVTSASSDFTKKRYYELIAHYYIALKEKLKTHGILIKDIINVDEFEATCKAALSYSKILKVFYYTVVGVSDEDFKEISEDVEKFNEFYYGNRTKYATACYSKDEEYRNNISQLIDDMVEDLNNANLKIEDIHYMVQKDILDNDYVILGYKLTPFGCYLDNLILEVNIMRKGASKVLQFFVKKMPDISNVKEKTLFQSRFMKEHAWYRKMVPFYTSMGININEDITKCYFSRLHDVSVYVDLTSQSYVPVYNRFSLKFDEVLFVIKKMASLHSKTIILEHSDKFKALNVEFYKKFKSNFIESVYYMPEKACNTFINAAKLGVLSLIDYFYDSQSKLSKEILKEQVLKIYDNLSEYMQPHKKHLNTLCHGDLSLLNLMFKRKNSIPVDCAIVDYQSYRYVPPAHDLMSFLYLATDREFRKVHMQKVIELYYDELREILKRQPAEVARALPDYNVFLESTRYYKLFAVAQTAIHFHISMLTEDQLKTFYSSPELHDKMFFEDRSEFIVNMCNSDPVYKEKLRETILDLQEYCGSNSAMKKVTVDRKSSKSEINFAIDLPFVGYGMRFSNVGLED